jgi:hypothetical protein
MNAGRAGGAVAGASGGGPGQAGASSEGLGDTCAYTDLTSKLNAIDSTQCSSGYCLWDGRSVGDSYCTIPCTEGSTPCPDGYECTEDLGEPGKFWCAEPTGGVPDDLGASCPEPTFGCYNSTYPKQSFCLNSVHDACAAEYCVSDPIAAETYCSLPCNRVNAPCPAGWDCRRNPSGTTGVHDVCTKHHDPIEYVGLPCYMGYRNCDMSPCPTIENQTTYSCADYVECPSGYVCTALVTNGAPEAPDSGDCRVEEL